eukprot:CAMPEP_0175166274 /NCGR_PEP_ID=MMETSP0087-20121206/27604_1 /TAXON_ID=136419 /ORGANISM="Unknown Unknown, Strain D1" /LENGTH=324 /DNA_ID=CAMNT_0016455851 /DNA_START=198 /DNA_END=1172 /DNA_ORIENTATION=-
MTKEECCALCQTAVNPTTKQRCSFSVWNPTALSCWLKTSGAVPFHKPGDVTCCPAGELGCPSAPPQGAWKLLDDFSDEFQVGENSVLPLNLSKWATNVSSWADWSWSPENVKTVTSSGGSPVVTAESGEVAGSYAAITMTYQPHIRAGKQYFYKSGIMKSTLPAGVTYGRFEARIKGASTWPGVCPAFWAFRRDPADNYWTELDFVEMTESQNNVHQIDFTSHVFPPTDNITKELSNATHKVLDFDPRSAFHVYAMEWNTTSLTWWVDGTVVKQMPASPYFNQGWPMDVALSLGLRPPLRDNPEPAGFPATFFVDWVRVWQRAD